MKKRIAIIPARGGSKRIPEKNIRNFCGKPMIAYVLEAAKKSGLFHTIHVSTENEKIKNTVEELGFKIDFLRAAELSGDITPIMPVLNYVVNEYEKKGEYFDEVWLLMACSPMLEAEDLIKAAALSDAEGGDKSIIAVSEYPVPIEWALTRGNDGMMHPTQPGMFAVRSQDFEKKYFDAGVFVSYPIELIKSASGAGSDMGKLGFVYPKERTIDIDDEADWKIAEALYQLKFKK